MIATDVVEIHVDAVGRERCELAGQIVDFFVVKAVVDAGCGF
jgi:hypothetical protein